VREGCEVGPRGGWADGAEATGEIVRFVLLCVHFTFSSLCVGIAIAILCLSVCWKHVTNTNSHHLI
jgi:hypothetical protein